MKQEECFQLLIIPPQSRPTFTTSEEDIQKASEIVNLYNGKKDIYRSIYNYSKEAKGHNALIDKVYIDFDPDAEGKGALANARKLSHYLRKTKIRHAVYFSGRGTHVYIYIHPIYAYELDNASMAIKNYVKELTEKLDLNPDWKVVGDLRRVSRLPNTLNTKTGLYCIPLCKSEIDFPREAIELLAKKQRNTNPLVDGDLVDIQQYDFDDPRFEMQVEAIDGIALGEDVVGVPICVEEILKRSEIGYQERYMVITALRDLAYSKPDIEKILEEHLTPEKFIHCIEEEGQLDYLFERQDLFFPNCNTIKSNGFCVEGCKGSDVYW